MPKPASAEVSTEFRYESHFVEVLGSQIHYVDEGDGEAILLLHSQATWSYVWRNVIPYLTPRGRVIAPDNIGFGKSNKPDIDYTYADHIRYIEGLIEVLGLNNVVVVGQGWGCALGLDYAARNEDNVRGVVFMEALVAPVCPAENHKAFAPPMQKFFETVRGIGNRNYSMEDALRDFTIRDLTDKEMDAYRAPFLEPASHKPLYVWPQEVPIGGEPAHTHRVISNYNTWLLATNTPKLFLYASPGNINGPHVAEWLAEHCRNIETVYIGPGLHFLQEDQPDAIGRAIADWLRRLAK